MWYIQYIQYVQYIQYIRYTQHIQSNTYNTHTMHIQYTYNTHTIHTMHTFRTVHTIHKIRTIQYIKYIQCIKYIQSFHAIMKYNHGIQSCHAVCDTRDNIPLCISFIQLVGISGGVSTGSDWRVQESLLCHDVNIAFVFTHASWMPLLVFSALPRLHMREHNCTGTFVIISIAGKCIQVHNVIHGYIHK